MQKRDRVGDATEDQMDVAGPAAKRFKAADVDFPEPPSFLRPLEVCEVRAHQQAERQFVEVNGEVLRRVVPYCHSFKTAVKGRWLRRSLIEVFSSEFGSHSPDYFQRAIEIGTLRVNGAKVSPTLLLDNNHTLTHLAHRHEPDVSATPIELLHDQEDEGGGFIVINKPAGMPVHPSGPCNYNSVLSLLVSEGAKSGTGIYRANAFLAPVHRLDRLTSGVLILAKPAPKAGSALSAAAESTAGRICRDIRDGKVQKRYAARVKGKFPVFDLPDTEGAALPSGNSEGTGKGSDKANFIVAPCPTDSHCPVCSQNKTSLPTEGEAGAGTTDAFLAGFTPALSGDQTTAGLDEHGHGAGGELSAKHEESTSTSASSASPTAPSPVRWSVGWRCPHAVARAGFSPAAWNDGTNKGAFIQVDIALITVDTKNARQGVATSGSSAAPAVSNAPAAHSTNIAAATPTEPVGSSADATSAAAPPAQLSKRDLRKQKKLEKSKHPYAIVPETGAVALPAVPKESVTLFRRLAYDSVSDESLVECRPLQGRSHQIRVHLAWLGFPIRDDPLYCEIALEELVKRDQEDLERSEKAASAAAASHLAGSTASSSSSSSSGAAGAAAGKDEDDIEALARSICVACTHPLGLRKELNVMQRLCRGISLHSWSYYTQAAPTGSNSSSSSSSSQASSGAGAVKQEADSTRATGCCYTAPLPSWADKFKLEVH
jgi:23S rRNA-/tRNA-specific pseudouridylate synthase